MKKLLAILTAIVVMATLFTGCAKTAPAAAEPAKAEAPAAETPAAEAPMAEKKYVIGISMDTQNSAYWQAMMTGIDEAVKERGNVEVKYLVAEGDSNTQNQQIETFISQGVDAIICVPFDSQAVLTAVTAANEANIPFIWCDREIVGNDNAKIAYGAGTDNYELTKGGTEWLVNYAKEKGIALKAVNIQGALTDEGAVNRSKAYEDVAAANPDVIEIVASIPTDWDFDVPYAALKSAIAANPDINCILAGSDAFWPACANALKETDKYAKTGEDNHVFFIGVDGEPYAIRALEQGYIDGDMCQPIMAAAKDCIAAAITLADGGTPEKTVNRMGGETITQDNFEQIGYTAYGYADRMQYDYDN